MNREVKISIGIFFISLFTFGIADVWFVYLISNRAVSDKHGNMLIPMREAVLYMLTLGFYGFVWAKKIGNRVDKLDGLDASSAQTKLGIIFALPFLRSFCVAYQYARLEGAITVEE